MKIIAYYLPQFHAIKENDKWWGKGFTEWVNVKAAKPLFKGHNQPRVPLNDNYYNLLDHNVMQNQFNLAKKYGIYGFCFYHYWFNGKKLLEKPLEDMIGNSSLNMPYCLSWANESWTNAWKADQKNKVLIEQKYGGKQDWSKHFAYLLQFFNDKNYIKNNNKPMFVIYRPELINCLNEMLDYWNLLAIKEGFDGIEFAYQHLEFDNLKHKDDSRFSYNIEYQPAYALNDNINETRSASSSLKKYIKRLITFFEKKTSVDFLTRLSFFHKKDNLKLYSYDKIWHNILIRKATSNKSIAGAFVDWDNTPRKQKRGFVISGGTPIKFSKYIKLQIENVKKNYSNDMIFIFAWNEWAEGGYLEPDNNNKYSYLESIKDALDQNEAEDEK